MNLQTILLAIVLIIAVATPVVFDIVCHKCFDIQCPVEGAAGQGFKL